MTDQDIRRAVGIVALPEVNGTGAALMIYSDGSYSTTPGVTEQRAQLLAQTVIDVLTPEQPDELADVLTVNVPTPISRAAFVRWYESTRPGADIPDPADPSMQQLVSEYLAASPIDVPVDAADEQTVIEPDSVETDDTARESE